MVIARCDKYAGNINTFFTRQAESKIIVKQIHLTYCLQPIRFTSQPTITMPTQTNNKNSLPLKPKKIFLLQFQKQMNAF